MAAVIYRPCYCTREEVKRALDVKQAAYANVRVDRVIQSATESVEGLTQRKFFIMDDTRFKDWPNYDYSYPWRTWLDQDELADVTVNVPVVNSGGVVIANNTILWGDPTKPHAPFTYFELNRSLNSSFGNGPTPQREISITGTFGYWLTLLGAGTLAASCLIGDQTITVSEGDTPGVGDLVIIDSERMIVTDATYTNTGISPSGASTASAADNIIGVPSGAAFAAGETVMYDTEWMLVQAIYGNNLTVKRAYDGSVLQAHTGGTLWARRLLTVLRGQLGTTAAGHNNGEAISVLAIPGLVKDLAIAEAVTTLTGEVSGYAQSNARGAGSAVRRTVSATSFTEPSPGVGLPDLRDRVMTRYGRQARSRVI